MFHSGKVPKKSGSYWPRAMALCKVRLLPVGVEVGVLAPFSRPSSKDMG